MSNNIYQPRCIDVAADGAYRGILFGFAWSISFRPKSGVDLWALHSVFGGSKTSDNSKRNEKVRHAVPKIHPYKSVQQGPSLRGPSKLPSPPPSPPSMISALDGILQSVERRTVGARSVLQRIHAATPPTVRYFGSNTAVFTLFIGVYNGTQCATERFRKKKDWINSFVAGFSGTAAIGLRNPNPFYMVATCIGMGALTGGFNYLSPGRRNE